MRTRRFVLLTKALGSASLLAACEKDRGVETTPANPKGSFYDAGVAIEPASTPAPDGGATPTPEPVPPPRVVPLPANPKGSHYDGGMRIPPPPPPPPAKK